MKTVPVDVHIKGIGSVITSGEYHIAPNAVGHIIGILQTLYAKPVAAVIREYLTNAIDAHTATGSTKKITVHLPTTLEQYYSVRDRGGGLSEADTIKHLYGVGSSGELKRQSNDQIGGFGVGAKCGYAVTNSFTYTVWHGGQKRVWSCEKDAHDRPVYKLIFQEPSDDDPGIEVMIPLPENKFASYSIQNAISETIPFVGHRDLLEFTPSQYVIPPEPKPITSLTRRMKFDGVPECDVEFSLYSTSAFENMGRRLPAVMTCAACYGIDRQIYDKLLNALTTKDVVSKVGANVSGGERNRIRLAGLIDRLAIKVPTGVLLLAPSREQLQYSPHTTAVLENIIGEFMSDSFQDDLVKNVNAELKTSTIFDRVQRLSMLKLGKDSKRDWVHDGSLIVPYRSNLRMLSVNVDDVTAPGSIDMSVNTRVNSAYIKAYSDTHPDIGPSVVTPDDSNKIRWRPRCTLVVLTDVPDSALCNDGCARDFGKRVFTHLYKMNPKHASMNSRYVNIVVIGTTDENVVPWLKDGSLPFVKIEEDLPEADDSLFWRRMSSYSTSRPGPRRAKAIGTQAFTLKKDAPDNEGVNSSWWEPVQWKNVKTRAGVFVTTKSFTVYTGHKWAVLTPRSFFDWVNVVAANASVILPDVFPDGEAKVYAVRHGTSAGGKSAETKMVEAGFKPLWAYMAERFKEDVKSGSINLDLLFHHIIKIDSANELKLVLGVMGDAVFAKSKAGELLVSYNNLIKVDKKVETVTKAWAAVICGLGAANSHIFVAGVGPSGTAILSAEVGGVKLFDFSNGTGVYKTWIDTQKPHVLNGWIRFSAITSEIPEVRNPIEEIVRKAYDDIPLARVILPISACCDTGKRGHSIFETIARGKSSNEFELVRHRSLHDVQKKYAAEEPYVTEEVVDRIASDSLFRQYITSAIDKVNDASTTKP